jgi:hypothetical protein
MMSGDGAHAPHETARKESTIRFHLRLLFTMLLAFAPLIGAWYWLQPMAAPVLARATGAIVRLVTPGLVEAAEAAHRKIDIVTRVVLRHHADGGREALTISVNPWLYGYGLPLFLALLCASRLQGVPWPRWWKLLLAVLTIVAAQSVSSALDFYQTLLSQTSFPLASSRLTREAVGFAYQFGALIIPSVLPIALWVALQRRYVFAILLSGGLQGAEDARDPSDK